MDVAQFSFMPRAVEPIAGICAGSLTSFSAWDGLPGVRNGEESQPAPWPIGGGVPSAECPSTGEIADVSSAQHASNRPSCGCVAWGLGVAYGVRSGESETGGGGGGGGARLTRSYCHAVASCVHKQAEKKEATSRGREAGAGVLAARSAHGLHGVRHTVQLRQVFSRQRARRLGVAQLPPACPVPHKQPTSEHV